MLDVTQATTLAIDFVAKMFPEATSIRLEEVEVEDSPANWSVTLSFPDPDSRPTMIAQTLMGGEPRLYKVIKLNRLTGDIKSMKIRAVE